MDFELISKITIPLLAAVLGAYFKQVFERKPKLIAYYGHTASHKVRSITPEITVHTHSVILRNAGKVPVTGIRLGHMVLPRDVTIFPPVSYKEIETEIVIEKLVPKDQVTVSYFYFSDITYQQVNSYVKHDQGIAKVVNVMPVIVPTKLQYTAFYTLAFLGLILALYIGWNLLVFLCHLYLMVGNFTPAG